MLSFLGKGETEVSPDTLAVFHCEIAKIHRSFLYRHRKVKGSCAGEPMLAQIAEASANFAVCCFERLDVSCLKLTKNDADQVKTCPIS